MHRETLKTIGLVIALVLVGILFLFVTNGQGVQIHKTDPGAIRALQAEGYTDIVERGYEGWACGKDSYGWNFEATSVSGARLAVVACTRDYGRTFFVAVR